MAARMALSFPNPSRSYDRTRHCIRFWAYDAALEIPFFVEAEVLYQIDPKLTRTEAGLLSVFDTHRDRIMMAADRVYSRHSRGSYTLSACDFP
jgi:Protein of unknown function (DUF1488)